MYESYWRLQARPFEPSSDPRFYFPSESHQAALLKLRYAIEHRRAAALVTAPAGVGKTMLVQQLLAQLPDAFQPQVNLVFPQMPADQLLAYLAAELTGESPTETPAIERSVRRVVAKLTENAAAGRHAVVVIDEAHLLRDLDVLEAVRLLLNFEYQGYPMLTMLLVGQPSMLPTLHRLPELDDRLDVKCVVPRLTLEETMAYITHRLHAAGAMRPIFYPDALEALHDLAQGVPRRLNRLADLALLIGFAQELNAIRAPQIEAVAEELLIGSSTDASRAA